MSAPSPPEDMLEEHGFAESDGARIHYVARGRSGPLLVMIHGFPDFWFTWRHQMPPLATNHRVIAIDLRGYSLSDRPVGAENYDMPLLMRDVEAVIRQRGEHRAFIIGHDWGGAGAAHGLPCRRDQRRGTGWQHPGLDQPCWPCR